MLINQIHQMPNWCDNYLEIIGDDDEFAKFMKENVNEDNELSFAMSVPDPDEVKDKPLTVLEGYTNNWYIENWGTKWNAQASQVGDDDITFQTAWGPPVAWLKKVAEKYASLEFTLRYAECGVGFSGLIEYHQADADGCVGGHRWGDCGDYYGEKYCDNCGGTWQWDCCETDWKHDYDMCVKCYDNACKTIKSTVRSKKIEKLPI